MKRVFSRHLLISGGLFGLVLGCLISAGLLATAHLQTHGAERTDEPNRTVEQGRLPVSPYNLPLVDGIRGFGAVASEPRFAATTWGLISKIAAAQFEAGQAESGQQTMTLIPAREESGAPLYRTQLDIAYDNLLSSIMQGSREFQVYPVTPESIEVRRGQAESIKVRLGQIESIVPRFSPGAARANAWFRIYEWVKQEHHRGVQDVDSSLYLSKAATEAGKIRDDTATPPVPVHLVRAWDRVGGELLLIWPIGLTILGSIGAEMLRKFVDLFGEDIGETAAGWLGNHRHPAEAVAGPTSTRVEHQPTTSQPKGKQKGRSRG